MIRVKVCGNRDTRAFERLVRSSANYLGLVLVPQSPRFVDGEELDTLLEIFVRAKVSGIRLVAVVENPTVDEVAELDSRGVFSALQFHGVESPHFIETVRQRISPSTELWKAVSLSAAPPPESLHDYESLVSSFVFDGPKGGSGIAFDWTVLNDYTFRTPFFLAGGISPSDATAIRQFARRHASFRGVDLNSRFEVAPGEKDIPLVEGFIRELQQ